MATTILILSALALAHFVYEGIIAPSLRLKLRFQLFELRDEVREIHAEAPKQVPSDVFGLVQDLLNTQIKILPRITLALIGSANAALERDQKLREEVESRITTLDSCRDPGIQDIRNKSGRVFTFAVITNAFGWVFYLWPLLFGLVAREWARMTVRRILEPSRRVLFVPESRVDQVVSDIGQPA